MTIAGLAVAPGRLPRGFSFRKLQPGGGMGGARTRRTEPLYIQLEDPFDQPDGVVLCYATVPSRHITAHLAST